VKDILHKLGIFCIEDLMKKRKLFIPELVEVLLWREISMLPFAIRKITSLIKIGHLRDEILSATEFEDKGSEGYLTQIRYFLHWRLNEKTKAFHTRTSGGAALARNFNAARGAGRRQHLQNSHGRHNFEMAKTRKFAFRLKNQTGINFKIKFNFFF